MQRHPPNSRRQLILAVCLGIICLAGYLAVNARAADTIEFNRDIRPILSDNCFQCHGPDSAQRKADLRLDVEASAKRDVEGVRPIVSGELGQSELYRRITTAASDERMPPVDSGKKLSAEQIELVARWIRGGAQWACGLVPVGK